MGAASFFTLDERKLAALRLAAVEAKANPSSFSPSRISEDRSDRSSECCGPDLGGMDLAELPTWSAAVGSRVPSAQPQDCASAARLAALASADESLHVAVVATGVICPNGVRTWPVNQFERPRTLGDAAWRHICASMGNFRAMAIGRSDRRGGITSIAHRDLDRRQRCRSHIAVRSIRFQRPVRAGRRDEGQTKLAQRPIAWKRNTITAGLWARIEPRRKGLRCRNADDTPAPAASRRQSGIRRK